MGSPPSQPAQTRSTTVSEMDPRLFEMLYGSSGAPGSQVMMASARNAKLMNQVQKGNRAAIEQFYGAPKGADLDAYQASLGTANPGVQKLAKGGKPKQSRFYTPFTMSDQYNTVPFYDPNSMQTTNPYFLQAIQQLQSMQQAPWQYDAASQGFQNLAGQSPYVQQMLAGMQGLTGENPYVKKMLEGMQGLTGENPYVKKMLEGMQGVAGKSWTDKGTAEAYMNPYIETALKSQQDIANRQFTQQQNQLNSQAAGRGAFGGSASALAQQAAQFNQNMVNKDLAAQGMNQAYQTGMQGFNADQNRQLQAYGQGLQGSLADTSTRLGAYNQGLQGSLADTSTRLGAYGQGLQGSMADMMRMMQANQGLLGAGQNTAAYNQGLYGNWGQAGNTLQNLAQNWYGNRANNANMFWNGVGSAAAPGTTLALQSPFQPGSISNQNYYGSR